MTPPHPHPPISLTPVTPQWEDDRIYLGVFERGAKQEYFAAEHKYGTWIDGNGCDLNEDGWKLIALSAELPLLGVAVTGIESADTVQPWQPPELTSTSLRGAG